VWGFVIGGMFSIYPENEATEEPTKPGLIQDFRFVQPATRLKDILGSKGQENNKYK